MISQHESKRELQEKKNEGSKQQKKASVLWKFYSKLCPCLKKESETPGISHQEIVVHEETRNDLIEVETKNSMNAMIPTGGHSDKLDDSLKISSKTAPKFVSNTKANPQFMSKSSVQKWNSYPISKLRQNLIIQQGKDQNRILVSVSAVSLSISEMAEKKRSIAERHETKKPKRYENGEIDKFWMRRYELFEKFDEGIHINEQGWFEAVPEAVCEYIANQIRCETVLDGFCGLGSVSIKLANTCSRVLSNDRNLESLKCLNNNAKVYCVDNIEIMHQNFFFIERKLEPDIIFLHPSFEPASMIFPEHFNPSFEKIMNKAFNISSQIVLLLPPNIDVSKLTAIISEQFGKLGASARACSVKLEKVFFKDDLRYILCYIGDQVQHTITLNDQLRFIYSILKNKEKGIFSDKKIIKKLREEIGMINLLNLVLEFRDTQSQETISGDIMDKFYEYIVKENILGAGKVQRVREQQRKENESKQKSKMRVKFEEQNRKQEESEEQKYVGEDQNERTISYYSMGSAANRISIQLKNNDESGIHKSLGLTKSQIKNRIQEREKTKVNSDIIEPSPRFKKVTSQIEE